MKEPKAASGSCDPIRSRGCAKSGSSRKSGVIPEIEGRRAIGEFSVNGTRGVLLLEVEPDEPSPG